METIQHQMPSSTSNPRTFTSREFSHKASSAKRAADFGPVFITDRGQAKHVLLSITDYQKLSKQHVRLSDLLACDDGDFDFEQYLPRFRDYPREVDFS